MEPLSTAEAVEVLELDGRVDAGSIKTAYRRLAQRHHPDHGGDVRRFQRVQEAYDVLSRTLPLGGTPAPQERNASVQDRWWESSTRWFEGEVDTSDIDWTRRPPTEGSFPVDRDLLATMLAGAAPVAPVLLRSRSPGAWSHRFIDWLQPDLLAQTRIAPAVSQGLPGHDVAVDLTFRSLKSRRLVGAASVPGGWVKHRGSASLTLQRVVHPATERPATAVRICDLTSELLDAIGWPLEDWFVVRS